MAATISATDAELTLPINAVMQEQFFLRQASAELVYMTGTKSSMMKKYEGTKTVMWRRVGALTPSTTALSEQTTTAAFFGGRDSDATSVTNVTAALSKYGKTVTLSEEAEIYSPKQQKAEVLLSLAICAGASLNYLQRDIVDDGATTIVRAGAAASTGAIVSKITSSSIEKVLLNLLAQKARVFNPMTKGDTREGTAPIQRSYWLICHNHVGYDISRMAGFKDVITYAGQVKTVPGEFGMLSANGVGVRCIQTSEGTVDANAGGSVTGTGLRSTGGSVIDIYTTAIYGQDALGSVGLGSAFGDGIYTVEGVDSLPGNIEIIEKALGSGGTSDPLNEISTMSYKFFHGGAVLNQNWVNVIKSGATDVTGA